MKYFIFLFLFIPIKGFVQKTYLIKLENCNQNYLEKSEFFLNNIKDKKKVEPILLNNHYYIEFSFLDFFADLEIQINTSDSSFIYKRYLIEKKSVDNLKINCRNSEIEVPEKFIDFVDFTKRNFEYVKFEQESYFNQLRLINASNIGYDSLVLLKKEIEPLKSAWLSKQLFFIGQNSGKLESLILLQRIIDRQPFLDNSLYLKTYLSLTQNLRNSKLGLSLICEIKMKMLRFDSLPLIGKKNVRMLDKLDMNGNLISLKDFYGKKVLLVFWATWCGPCVFELPFLKKINEENKDLVLIGLSEDKDLNKLKTFIDINDIKWPQIIIDENIKKDFNVGAIPVSILIDKNGFIENIHTGGLDYDGLKKFLKNQKSN